MIGLITPDEKCAGARSAGNPHAACEAEGTGNGVTDHPRRARRGKPRIQTRKILRATAPVLDPTAVLRGDPVMVRDWLLTYYVLDVLTEGVEPSLRRPKPYLPEQLKRAGTN